MIYLKKSMNKFKDDLLSKGLYDLLKWLIILLIGLLITWLIPSIKLFLMSKVRVSIYVLIILSVLFILLIALLISYNFRKKIKNVIDSYNIDELTGLKNHKALNEYLAIAIPESIKKNENLAIILMDVDDFKDFNSKNTYNKADSVLKKIGELLSNDKRATDETFRFFNRGDEFLVVAKETSLNQAFEASERKRKLIEKNLFSVDGVNYKLTVSCGVTILKKDDTIQSLTDRVTEALKEAKGVSDKNNSKTIS